MESSSVIHPFPPVYDLHSEILILGSFPSVKSREVMFYYGHPQNRFWKIMESLYGVKLENVEDKKRFLLSHHIALWDSIASCRIQGSSDSSITDVVVNDLSLILKSAQIKKIFCNGKKSYQYYAKYLQKQTGMEAICLLSTSPANAVFQLPQLVEQWKIIDEYIKKD